MRSYLLAPVTRTYLWSVVMGAHEEPNAVVDRHLKHLSGRDTNFLTEFVARLGSGCTSQLSVNGVSEFHFPEAGLMGAP